MVIHISFLPALCDRVSQRGSHWSQHDRGDRRTLVKPYVQNTRGILHKQFPQEITTHISPWSNGHQGGEPLWSSHQQGAEPPFRGGTPGLPEAATTSPHGSFQVDMADIIAHSSHSLSHNTPERDTSPTPLPLLVHSVNLLDNVLCLQEEMNEALVYLLSARATAEMHHQQIISETEVSHCQNKINTSEAIWEIKALYTTLIADAEAAYGTSIRKAEAVHLASTSKVEVIWATRIRKVKVANAVQASKLQWQHQEAMQNLEEEALEL